MSDNEQTNQTKSRKKQDPVVSVRDDTLLSQGDRFQGPLRTLERELDVKGNPAAAVKRNTDQFREADTAYNQARTERRDVLAPRKQELDAKTRRYIRDSKYVLKDQFGPRWSASWGGIGFKDNKLAVPSRIGERLALLERIAAWFRDHPDLENTSLGVTAQAGFELHANLTQALNELDAHGAKESQLAAGRQASRKTLRKRIRLVIGELGLLLADDDERWKRFDLTPPAVVNERRRQARAKTTSPAASEASPEFVVVEAAKAAA